jgi:hypothetical protein
MSKRVVKAYQGQFNPSKIKKIGRVSGDFSVTLRVNLWLQHLSDETEFDKFFRTGKDSDPGDKMKKMSTENLERYTLQLDQKYRKPFQKNCRKNKMSLNYALNLLVDKYCKEGKLFEIKIWI